MNSTVTDERSIGVSLKRYLMGGLLAGIIAAVLNNIYHTAYTAITGVEATVVINYVTVSIASIVPLVLAALVYYFLSKETKQPTMIFIVITIFLTITSSGLMAISHFPDRTPVPEGFVGLALPMHYIAGAVAAIFIPWYVSAGKRS